MKKDSKYIFETTSKEMLVKQLFIGSKLPNNKKKEKIFNDFIN